MTKAEHKLIAKRLDQILAKLDALYYQGSVVPVLPSTSPMLCSSCGIKLLEKQEHDNSKTEQGQVGQ